jgi:flagellin-like hook-associated protein FlgL
LYSHDTSGSDLDPQLIAASLLTDINNRLGTEPGEFVIYQGDSSLRVNMEDPSFTTVQDVLDYINDSSLGVEASINDSGNGIQIRNADSYRSLMIEDVGDGRAARSMGLYGSSDMSGTMLALVNALKSNDKEAIGMLLDNFDEATTQALEQRAWVGSTALRLETTDSRLIDLGLSFTGLLSEVEDGDMTQLITELATYETNYQAALAAAARIIQPSLMNFLD